MAIRHISGNIISWFYNEIIGRFPFPFFRKLYLRGYLKRFGEKSRIGPHCRFLNGRKVFIGNNNSINDRCVFDGRIYKIEIGDNVSIGPEATILTLSHDPQSEGFADQGGDVKIGDRAWVAYRATILPGVTIGEGAVVGAGSVVTRDVPPFTIVAGAPAREIGKRNANLNYVFFE